MKQKPLGSSIANQFELDNMVAAAEFLADASMGAIVWNGTAASCLSVGRDEELCPSCSGRWQPTGQRVISANIGRFLA